MIILTLSMHMQYGTSWPDNADAVAVQLDKMIISIGRGTRGCLLELSLKLCTLHDAIIL